YYRLDATHLCEPSLQRTPVLYQAGASTSGRAFAAAHAECVFINGPSRQVVAPQVADIRRRAAALGRDPSDILIFTLTTVISGRGPVFVGSPQQIADEMTLWVEATGIDGFNLAYAVTPESFEDFVELVIPELQRRGVYKRDYRPGTYREKLFSRGPHIAAPHPAARYRAGP